VAVGADGVGRLPRVTAFCTALTPTRPADRREDERLSKTPFRLLYFPGLAVAVVMAALILAATATMGRLFLAAAGDAALAQELRAAGGVPALAIVMFSSFEPDTVDSIDASARSAVRVHGPGLAPAVRTMLGPSVPAAAGGRVTSVQLAARDGFAAHIHPIARTFGQGVWMPDTAARLLGIRPGQTLTLGTGPSVEVRVVGVYRDLARADGPLDPFWSPLSSSIYTANAERNPAARLLLVDPDRLAQLGSALDMHGRLEWDFYPGPGPLTLPRSQALVTDIQRVEGAVGDPLTPLGKLRATTSSSLAQLVDAPGSPWPRSPDRWRRFRWPDGSSRLPWSRARACMGSGGDARRCSY
jgi:hypothetical protein